MPKQTVQTDFCPVPSRTRYSRTRSVSPTSVTENRERNVTREPWIEAPWGSLKGDFAEIERLGWRLFHSAWARYHAEQRAELER